jgi:hypothetical protein
MIKLIFNYHISLALTVKIKDVAASVVLLFVIFKSYISGKRFNRSS